MRADFHTYFVGCDEWGFSVWAHNADGYLNHGVQDATQALQERLSARLLGEVQAGKVFPLTSKFSADELSQIITHAKGVEGLLARDVDGLVTLAHRANKPRGLGEVLEQLTELGRSRQLGRPAAFADDAAFKGFSSDLLSLVERQGMPRDTVMLLQGSTLRKAAPPDVDLIALVGGSYFKQVEQQALAAIKRGAVTGGDARILASQVLEGRINRTFLDAAYRKNGFATGLDDLMRHLPESVGKIDFSVAAPRIRHTEEALSPVWRLLRG